MEIPGVKKHIEAIQSARAEAITKTGSAEPNDEIITMSQAARALGKTQTTIKRWIMDGLLNAVRMPSGIFGLRRSELNKFLGGCALPQKEIA